MGLLRNYEAVGPFVTASNDAFNRLKPGFEAPVCIVAAVGPRGVACRPATARCSPASCGTRRTRSRPGSRCARPNPHTNTYLAVAAFGQAMLDGMALGRVAAGVRRASCRRISPSPPARSTPTSRRTGPTAARRTCSSTSPRTSGIGSSAGRRPRYGRRFASLDRHPDKLQRPAGRRRVLARGCRLLPGRRRSLRWATELTDRVIPENASLVHACVRLQGENRLDAEPLDDHPGAQGRAGAGRREPHVDLHARQVGRGGG